jgi:DNA-binding CsgD family transcriptional regulator
MKLTAREEEILQLHSIGLTPDEIADKLYRSRETIRKTICNIKIKLNLQKASELTAYYWCEFFGASFVEQRNSILSACACLLLLFTFSVDNFDKRRFRIRSRKECTESTVIYSTL